MTRIHNRYQHQRFERRLASLSDATEAQVKRYVEHLFVGEHPALPDEVGRVVREGFRPAAETAALGLDGAVRLANCVNLADAARLHSAVEKMKGNPKETPTRGRVIIARAYLGASVQDRYTVNSGAPDDRAAQVGKITAVCCSR